VCSSPRRATCATAPPWTSITSALIDLYGSQGAGLTNLSLGGNYKPNPRLRLTASVNRVDVDTLAVQANAFLADPENQPIVQNETYFRRLATNVGRVGVSAGLGRFQRFELSFQAAYRYRPGVAIPQGDGTVEIPLEATKGSISTRSSSTAVRSRTSVSESTESRSFGRGRVAFNRSEILALRAFASRELRTATASGRPRSSTRRRRTPRLASTASNVYTCYGSSLGSILQAGANLYYRYNRDWFLLGHSRCRGRC
jgi:hypothetical protein